MTQIGIIEVFYQRFRVCIPPRRDVEIRSLLRSLFFVGKDGVEEKEHSAIWVYLVDPCQRTKTNCIYHADFRQEIIGYFKLSRDFVEDVWRATATTRITTCSPILQPVRRVHLTKGLHSKTTLSTESLWYAVEIKNAAF